MGPGSFGGELGAFESGFADGGVYVQKTVLDPASRAVRKAFGI